MNARICSNPTCRTILPYDKCCLCGTATDPLPPLALAPIGVNGKARLVHQSYEGYSILVDTISGPHSVHLSLNDLLRPAQLRLPGVDPASGLEIMDTLGNAARLMRTKNSGHWAGWVIYLLECLQGTVDHEAFQDVLNDLRHDLNQVTIGRAHLPSAPDAARHPKSAWSEGRGYAPPETS